MKRIVPPKISFVYLNEADSDRRLQMAYNRVFEIAARNLLSKRQIVQRKEVGGGMKPVKDRVNLTSTL